MNVLVLQGGPYFAGIVPLVDGSHGTVGGTLSALDTGALAQRYIRRRRDPAVDSPAEELDGPHVLHILTNLNTAATPHAFSGFRIIDGLESSMGRCLVIFWKGTSRMPNSAAKR